ncbi:MAG: tRNA (adenosine(37)-N6)-dimethylallyltransferase MiaA [Treponemataceae bacterium]|nr:tRNA (adenosine(37)-N6)-dimethylallyltransferase MiaA [Treponemataceae bacterium]
MMTENQNIPVLIIFAPTACGKTALVSKLFSESDSKNPSLTGNSAFSGRAEIISADSMQVYKGMDIGTAKPDSDFCRKLPHHLIDLCTPDVQFGAGEFVRQADIAAKEIFSRGKLPVLCGGTAFYIKNFIYGLPPTPQADETVRNLIEERMKNEGAQVLWNELKAVDPESAEKIHVNDEYRIKRALEVYAATGKKRSEFECGIKPRDGYDFTAVSLVRPRAELYGRINLRVDQMFEQGLEKEFSELVEAGFTKDMPGMQAIGYREFWAEDCSDRIRLIESVKNDTRHYAKRQETFFNSLNIAEKISADDYKSVYEKTAGIFEKYFSFPSDLSAKA